MKLADFGVATKLTEANINEPSYTGTAYWMAPEVLYYDRDEGAGVGYSFIISHC